MKKIWSMFLALTFLLSMLAVPSALAEEAPPRPPRNPLLAKPLPCGKATKWV